MPPKFPKRKKRTGSVSAHIAATSPFNLSPALTSVRDLHEKHCVERPEGHIQGQDEHKLRHKRKSRNLRRRSRKLGYEDLDDSNSVDRVKCAYFFPPADGHILPAIVVTPPTPKKVEPVEVSSSGQSSETLPRSSSLGSLTSLTSLSSLSSFSSLGSITSIKTTLKSMALSLVPRRLRRTTAQISQVTEDDVPPEEPVNRYLAPPTNNYGLDMAW